MENNNATKQNIKEIKEIFGSFFLMGSEFALSVSYVQEVVHAPRKYTTVPLSPNYLKGLFNLRGTIIPVIDLKDLLGLNKGQEFEAQQIAIIELHGTCVGLLFDKTGEVFKNSGDERSDFETDDSNSVVAGVFKKDAGKRIVQILDVSKLFKLQNVPKDSAQNRLNRESLEKKRGIRKQCISFIVGPAKCSLPISDIQEIIKVDKVNESALGFGNCIGIIDIRGSTVPVIDFPALLKYRDVDRSENATQGDRRILVMRLDNELFGLIVDAIDSIITFFPDEVIAFPVIEQERADMILGCLTGHGDSDLLLLDYQKILTNSEINEITRGHSKLYQAKEIEKDKAKTKGGSRRTCLTFKIEGTYAVAINDVNEIIDYSNNLLQLPGLKQHVKGVLNLRGELVTIVDARSMYSISSKASLMEPQKVLVFKSEQLCFGLIVDSVESIITFAENDKIKLPEVLYSQGSSSIIADLSESIEVLDNKGQKKNMLIISLASLIQRIMKTLSS